LGYHNDMADIGDEASIFWDHNEHRQPAQSAGFFFGAARGSSAHAF
jgi:hypothetical protein